MWLFVWDKELALDRDVVEVTVPVRRWPKRRGFSSPSVSEEDAVLEVGGEASPALPPYTRAYGALVRRVGVV